MTVVVTRRRLLATTALAWLAMPALAAADVEWCFDDPPVLVRLPSGAPINVNVRVRVPVGRRAQLQATVASGAVVPVQNCLAIQINILVPSAPDDPFPLQVTADVHKAQVQVVQSGMAGTPLVILLPLPPS